MGGERRTQPCLAPAHMPDPWLLLHTKAPVWMPISIHFSCLFFAFCQQCQPVCKMTYREGSGPWPGHNSERRCVALVSTWAFWSGSCRRSTNWQATPGDIKAAIISLQVTTELTAQVTTQKLKHCTSTPANVADLCPILHQSGA